MEIRILSAARDDLAEEHCFYEMQGAGVGGYFVDSLASDIDSLALYAGIHGKVFGFYRMLSHRFPWAIYYRFEGEGAVVVFRVLDCRQEPRKIGRALRA